MLIREDEAFTLWIRDFKVCNEAILERESSVERSTCPYSDIYSVTEGPHAANKTYRD